MAFPADPLPIKQELLINGVWTDVTTRTRGSDNITITRGYSAEQASLSSSQCRYTLNNRDGLFSNRNPSSPYYRQIGRNTQYRCSVQETTAFLSMRDISITSTGVYDGAEILTADKASLDVVGDMDIRIDVDPDNWRTNTAIVLASKWVTTGNQRSWLLGVLRTGKLFFSWTNDGSTRRTFVSSVALPATGRLALRVTLDVDNGASGCTGVFYTSDTIGGTYTQLGTTQISSGVTTVYSSSAPLEVGAVNNAADRGTVFLYTNPFVGRIYGFQFRNGIAGTLVANMDATSRTPGDTSWSDGLTSPNTWTTAASATITKSDFRFWGEVSKLPQRWDSSGQDVYVPVNAADLIQRLGSGQKALESPIYRNLTQYPIDGYFPLESGAAVPTTFGAYVGQANQLVGANFGTDATLPGTAGALFFNDDTGYLSATSAVGANTGTAYVLTYFKMPSTPIANVIPFNYYYTGGNVYRLTIQVGTAAFTFTVVDSSGAVLYTSAVTFGAGGSPNQWLGMRVRMVQSGGNINIDMGWYSTASQTFFGSSGTFAGTVGRPRSFISFPYTGKTGLQIAHVVLSRTDVGFTNSNFFASTNGYIGEGAATRALRLSREQNVPFWVVGNSDDRYNEPMGAQTTSTYLDLMNECASLAGALLYSPRDKFGLAMRLTTALRFQGATALSYTSKHLSGSLEPEEDDSLIRNDVTVTRPNGTFGRKVKTAGTLNSLDPTTGPDSVGLYDTSITLNAATDAKLPLLAQREVFFGTWDELRYPKVQVELERAPFVASATLTRAVRALDLGDAFSISNLPKWLPPETVELLMLGYTETLKNRGQQIIFNSRPYGPFRALNDLNGGALGRFKIAAAPSTVGTGFNSTATSISIASVGRALWGPTATKPGNFPQDIFINGERMTVTAITGTTSPQTFTVTRSVNGVAKSHVAGETVQIFDIFYVAS